DPKVLEEMSRHAAIRAVGELQTATLIRAVESKRQFKEVLVDFWGNHFNIDVKKSLSSVFKTIDDREVIRPHVFGKFRDLLSASAHSPSMMIYLYNMNNAAPKQLSAGEQQAHDQVLARAMGVKPGKSNVARYASKEGINENYARELMELHTL